ncbi:hypothetical protein GCM10010470_47480 [Saccharopolyspora taberi]|uniref:Uncharacterized protein n=1 Tax=Saccharopolyspora taberi TaxID=60895 RepID=A0ABN3VHT9_9PSEU
MLLYLRRFASFVRCAIVPGVGTRAQVFRDTFRDLAPRRAFLRALLSWSGDAVRAREIGCGYQQVADCLPWVGAVGHRPPRGDHRGVGPF